MGKQLNAFLQALLRQQAQLVETGQAEHNESLVRELVTKYKGYAAYKFTDMGAAIFIKKHYNNLLLLVPRNQTSTSLKLADLVNKSDIILNH